MTVSAAQHKGGFSFGSGASFAVTLDSDTITGNTIALFVKFASDTATLDSVTDTDGNTYTIDKNVTGSTQRAYLAYAVNITGGTTPTITANFSASVSTRGMVITEVGGVATTSFDASAIQFQSIPGTGVDAVKSGTVTTAEADEFLFGATVNFDGVDVTSGTGFTVGIGSNTGVESEFDLVNSLGSNEATFTNPGAFQSNITGIMAFKPSGGPATGYPAAYYDNYNIGQPVGMM